MGLTLLFVCCDETHMALDCRGRECMNNSPLYCIRVNLLSWSNLFSCHLHHTHTFQMGLKLKMVGWTMTCMLVTTSVILGLWDGDKLRETKVSVDSSSPAWNTVFDKYVIIHN